MKKKFLLMTLMLLCAVAQGVHAQSLSFISHGWDETKKEVTSERQEISDYVALSGSHTDDWVNMGTDSKYVVTENASYNVLNVTGTNAHLYLCDGVTLNVKHIKLEKGRSLHIHAQSEGHSDVGKLIVKNNEYSGAAGIGGGDEANAGDLYIHGGDITSTANDYAAGIGGGDGGQGGSLYVYAGSVTANGGTKAAGIGGGQNNSISKECSINIYDGTVNAYGNGQYDFIGYYKAGAGIGGGDKGDQGGDVNIYGGQVTAESKAWGAAGIGGGYKGLCGVVNISGGKVTVIGYKNAGAGIGNGVSNLSFDGIITITGGTIDASGTAGFMGKTTISDATVIFSTNNNNVSAFLGELTFKDNFMYRVTQGTDKTTWNDTPVAFADRKKACVDYYKKSFSLKIEPCESHHFVDYRCAYCGNGYYETTSDSWIDDGKRAASFSSEDTENKVITIMNEAELGLFAYNVSHNEDYKGWTIKVDKDLDMTAYPWLIGSTFMGTFDGQGHTIKGIHYDINHKLDAGLFYSNAGTVKNVKLASSVLIGDRYVGAIAGTNTGTVENCRVSSDVSVICNTSDDNRKACGGVVGLQIKAFDTSIGSTKGCYSEASLVGVDNVGGIVGEFNGGSLTDCVSKATFSATGSNKGILVGSKKEDTTLSNNYYIAEQAHTDANAERLFSVKLSNELAADEYMILNPLAASSYYDASRITILTGNARQVEVGDDWYIIENGAFSFQLPVYVMNHTKVSWSYVNVNGGEELTPENSTYSFNYVDGVTEYVIEGAAWDGEGTQESPYLIQSTADWNILCRIMQSTSATEFFNGKHFKQTADIDINQGVGVTGESNDKEFRGTYDGDGHRLNCMISNPVENSTEAVAPFHKVKTATIENLIVTGFVSGGIHSAGLVAFTDGNVQIKNCRVSTNVTCTGNSTNDAHGGGIVGHAQTSTISVKNSLFDGNITATPNNIGDIRLGAIVGWGGELVNVNYCMERGAYSGTTDNNQTAFCWKVNSSKPDIATYNVYVSDLGHGDGADKVWLVTSGTEGLDLDFSNGGYKWNEAYHDAVFKDENSSTYLIGGMFYAAKDNNVTFTVSYPENDMELGKVLVNDAEIKASENKYTFTQGEEQSVVTAEFLAKTWISNGVCATEFSTIELNTIHITNEQELALLAKQVYTGANQYPEQYFVLDNDLDMSAYEWVPIGNGLKYRFRGWFDGKGHTIKGIHIDSNHTYVGLFGVVAENASVRDLKLTDSSLKGSRYVGAIAADLRGVVDNCYVGSDVEVTAVTVDGDSDSGKDCGGVVGYMQNQSTNSNATVLGCYSEATVTGKAHVGGIVGNMISGLVRETVSKAAIVSEGGTKAYIAGNKTGGTIEHSYHIAGEKINNNDTRAYHVTLADDLKKGGYEMTYTGNLQSRIHKYSGLTFIRQQVNAIEHFTQFQVGDEWYGTYGEEFRFYLPDISCGSETSISRATLKDIKVNGTEPEKNGFYYFTTTEEAVVTGSTLLMLDNYEDNSELIEKFDGLTVNVELYRRTLYHDGSWNTICLPFDITISGSVLEGATARALAGTYFKNSTLTLSFGNGVSTLSAGMPYIIGWADEDDNIENPKFTGVTISSKTENTTTLSYVDFMGSFSPVSLAANDRTVLYMGADNKLYYPDEDMTVGAFRAYFKLKDGLTAGDPASSNVKAFRLDFNDEATGITTTDFANSADENDSWFTIDGRQLSGQPAQPGIYIHNGQKVMMK